MVYLSIVPLVIVWVSLRNRIRPRWASVKSIVISDVGGETSNKGRSPCAVIEIGKERSGGIDIRRPAKVALTRTKSGLKLDN